MYAPRVPLEELYRKDATEPFACLSDTHILNYVRKLIQLEECLGATLTYAALRPFAVNGHDIIEIQRAASRIAHFVHLDKLTFRGFRPLRKHVAGSIELRKGQKEVIVDVDPLLQDNPDGLRVVFHQIAHKVMHTHGISAGHGPSFEFENEVFTDITAVFMGLGKLMLNGCQTERVDKEAPISRGSSASKG